MKFFENLNGLLSGFDAIYRGNTITPNYDFEGKKVIKISSVGFIGSGDRATECIQYVSEKEIWGIFKIFFPENFVLTASNKWFDFFDLFEYNMEQGATVSSNLTFVLQVWQENGNLRLIARAGKTSQGQRLWLNYIHTKTIYLKRGMLHTFKFHQVRDKTDGLVEFWVDGDKFAEYHGETLYLQDRQNVIWAKHYANLDESMQTAYYYDMIGATTEQELAEAQPEPEPVQAGFNIVLAALLLLLLLAAVLVVRGENKG